MGRGEAAWQGRTAKPACVARVGLPCLTGRLMIVLPLIGGYQDARIAGAPASGLVVSTRRLAAQFVLRSDTAQLPVLLDLHRFAALLALSSLARALDTAGCLQGRLHTIACSAPAHVLAHSTRVAGALVVAARVGVALHQLLAVLAPPETTHNLSTSTQVSSSSMKLCPNL